MTKPTCGATVKQCVELLLLVLIVCLSGYAQPVSAAPSDALVGHWRFDDGVGTNAADSSGQGHAGTLTNMNGVADWVTEKPSLQLANPYALDFDGTNDYVDIGIDAYGLGIRRYATFSAWVRPDTTTGGSRTIMGDWQGTTGGFAIRLNDTNTITFYVYPNNHRITTTAKLTLNAWNHVAAVMDGANMYVYLNGVQVGTTTLGEDMGNDTNTIKVGRRGDASGYMNGQIDDVRIYDEALSPSDISTLSTGNEFLGVTIAETLGSTTVSEGRNTDTYTVVLNTQPDSNVDISVSSSDTASGATVSPSSLTFTTDNWNVPQTVTVTAVEDDDIEGDHSVTITHVASSADDDYDGMTIASVAVAIVDPEVSISITETSGSTTLTEGGSSDTYTVLLNSQPSSDVTIAISSDSTAAGIIISPSSLTFTTDNWGTPQTVTVSPVDDTDIEGIQSVTITHTASSADNEYNGITIDTVAVTITDNENPYQLSLLDRSPDLGTANSQGIAFDGTYYYYSDSVRIYKYTRDVHTGVYTLVTSRSVTGDDPVAKTQINSMNYYDGYLWIGANNHDQTPHHGWVMKYDPASLTHVATYVTEDHFGEGGAWHDVGAGEEFWAVYSDWDHVTRYRIQDGAFVKVDDYLLSLMEGEIEGVYQGAVWYGDIFIAQTHNVNDDTATHFYRWNGNGFTAVQVIPALGTDVGQGLHWETEGEVLLFAERQDNDHNGQTIVRGAFSDATRNVSVTQDSSPSEDDVTPESHGGGRRGTPGRGTATIIMNHSAVSPSPKDTPAASLPTSDNTYHWSFSDVPRDAWFFPSIEELLKRKIISGYADERGVPLHLFSPADPVTIGQTIKIALLAAKHELPIPAGLPNNPTATDWSAPYIALAESLGLTVSSADVHANATRGEVIQTLLEAFDISADPSFPNPFSDLPANHPHASIILTAAKLGIIRGDSREDGSLTGTVRPDEPINRAEVSKIVAALCQMMD